MKQVFFQFRFANSHFFFIFKIMPLAFPVLQRWREDWGLVDEVKLEVVLIRRFQTFPVSFYIFDFLLGQQDFGTGSFLVRL